MRCIVSCLDTEDKNSKTEVLRPSYCDNYAICRLKEEKNNDDFSIFSDFPS